MTLLNELALVANEYSNEDSNTKFMRALTEEWDLKTTIIRDDISMDGVSLDKIYGRLRTHDLEIQQRKNMKSTKTKFVALNSKSKNVERFSSFARRKAKYVEISESEVETNSDDDSDSDSSDVKMKEIIIMIVKGFKKMKYKKFRKAGNTSKKVSGDVKTDRYKKKDDKENKSRKFDKEKVKCYNCDGMGHFATKCRKAKFGKEKTLISEKKDWMDSSDFDEEVNYALMTNVKAKVFSSEKLPNVIYNFDTNNMLEHKSILKNLHMSFKNQTIENDRLKLSNEELS